MGGSSVPWIGMFVEPFMVVPRFHPLILSYDFLNSLTLRFFLLCKQSSVLFSLFECFNKFGQLIDASFRPIFSTKFEERRMDQQKYLPIEMQFYISVMFLGLPDDIHEEKPSFLQFKKKCITDGRTDRWTDQRTDRPSYRDA